MRIFYSKLKFFVEFLINSLYRNKTWPLSLNMAKVQSLSFWEFAILLSQIDIKILKKFFYLSSFTEIWFWPGSEITWTFGSGSGINLFRYDTLGFMIKSLRRKHEFSFHNGRKCRKVWLPALRHLSGGVLRTIVHHNHFIAPFSSLYTKQTKIIFISAET